MKKQIKKTAGIFALTAVMLGSIPTTTYAQGSADIVEDEIGIVPFNTHIASSSLTFSISGSKASVATSITGYSSSVDKVGTTVVLQRYNSSTGTWGSSYTWTNSNDKYYGSFGNSTTLSTSGKYRVKVTFKAYKSNVLKESKTDYSSEKSY